jgi:hypothetical protein
MTITTLAGPPNAGAVRLRGTMAAELPTAPEGAPPHGAAGPAAPQASEAALLRGAADPAPTTELSVVGAAGADSTVDSGDNRPPIVERFANTIGEISRRLNLSRLRSTNRTILALSCRDPRLSVSCTDPTRPHN